MARHPPILARPWEAPNIVHVRPANEQYDEAYYAENLDNFRKKLARSPLKTNTLLYKGTIQELTSFVKESADYPHPELMRDREILKMVSLPRNSNCYDGLIADLVTNCHDSTEHQVDYCLMDVHYYLQPRNKSEREQMFW